MFAAIDGTRLPSMRLACLNIPQSLAYQKRPAEEYEKLEGGPFWLRD